MLKYYKSMVSPMLQYVKYIMIVTGTFPVPLIISRKRIYTYYQNMIQTSLAIFFIFIYGFIPHFEGSVGELFNVVNNLVIYTTVNIKGLVCISKNMRKLISDLIAYERELMESNNAIILTVYQNTINKSKLIQVFYIVTMYCSAASFLIPHFVNYVRFSKGPTNSSLSNIKSTPYNWWLPFDEDKYYLETLLLKSFCALLMTNYYCFIEIILIVLPLYIILRLKILKIHLKSINSIDAEVEDEMEIVRKLVIIYIEEHIDIIKNCVFLNTTIKYVMLLEFLLTSVQLSLALFQLISTTESGVRIFSAVYIFQTLVQLLLLYWYANQIREESVAITKSAYEIRWYEYDTSIKTNLRIMMMRSQKSLSLTIGPFGDMTLEMAVKIIKAVYTYITFMQQNYGKN